MTIALRFDTRLVWLNEHPCCYPAGGQIKVKPPEAIWNFSTKHTKFTGQDFLTSWEVHHLAISSEKVLLNVGRALGETAKKDEKLSM